MRWVTPKTAAALSEVHIESMWRWCRAGRVRSKRLAGSGPWRVLLDDENSVITAEQKRTRVRARR